MLRFSEFASQYEKEIPAIQCDIQDDHLMEAIDVGRYDNYIGPEEGVPEKNGYKKVFATVYSHPNHPGKYFHFAGTSKPKVFDDLDDAFESETAIRREKESIANTIGANLSKHYAENKYEGRHLLAFKSYTDANSNINFHLLRGYDLKPHHRELVDNLDHALHREHTPDEMVVYSGTNDDHANILRHNDVVHHPGYVSSSIDLKKAVAFAKDKSGDVLKIHLPAGHPGTYVQHMSSIPSEREFIMPRNMKLRIDHSKREVIVHDLHKGEGPIYVHHAYPVED